MNRLSPFKWFVLQNFPFIEADFDALTNYELMCKVVEYLNVTIAKTNELGNQVEVLTNWFNDLDVQDEINNKLDEMAENGQLADIIAQYLNSQCVFGFKSISDMSASSELANGSIARTLGQEHYYDGDGDYYYVRYIQNTDVIDGVNKVALADTSLVAVRIASAQITALDSRVSNLESQISEEKIIVIGDSYANADTTIGSDGWVNYFKQYAKISDSNIYNFSVGGAGFVSNGTNTYLANAQNRESQVSDKNAVKKIIIAGGWNDRGASESDTLNAIESLATYLKTTYPNAKMYCGMIANYKPVDDTAGNLYWRNHLRKNILPRYKRCNEHGITYLYGVEEVMHNYSFFVSDGVHPNEDGAKTLARAIYNSLYQGNYSSQYAKTFNINSDSLTLNADINTNTSAILQKEVQNGLSFYTWTGALNINNKSSSNKVLTITICDLTDDIDFLRYVDNNSYIRFTAIVSNSSNSQVAQGTLRFTRNGKVQMQIQLSSDMTNVNSINYINLASSHSIMFE